MTAAASVVSLLCTVILAIFLFVRRVRGNVARLALVSWLLGCNLVQGINAIVWSSNVDLKGLAWCDIVTKLALATTVAVPAACLCISRNLEMVSSTRDIPSGAKTMRNWILFDAFVCYFVPLIYMPLYIVGQDYRFDIVQGIGCMASVHPSTPASMVVWLPHIIMGILSLVNSGLAVHNSFRHSSSQFSAYLEGRSHMNSSIWGRTLTLSIVTTCVTMLVIVFSMFSLPMTETWSSWQHVHEHFAQVLIVQEKGDVSGIKTIWWGMRAITITYIALVLLVGEETRDVWKYLQSVPIPRPSFSLRPLMTLRRHQDNNVFGRPPSWNKPARPLTLELRSGWDDDLNVKPARSLRGSKKSSKLSPPVSPCPSPSPTTTEDSFVKSTMPYLGSGIGDSLGFHAPVLPTPVYKPPFKIVKPVASQEVLYETPSPRPIASPSPSPRRTNQTHNPMESKASNNIRSMLEEHWPLPPVLVPSPVPSGEEHFSDEYVSRASSPALSMDERREACSYFPSSSYFCTQDLPFEGSSVHSPSPLPEDPEAQKSRSRRPSLKSLRGSLRKGQARSSDNGVIHMATVRETV